MKTNTVLIELVADEGKKITNKERNAVFTKIMVKQADIDNYYEVSDAEAVEIEKAMNTSEETKEV